MFKNISSFFDKYAMQLPDFALTGGSPLNNPDAKQILSYLRSNSKSKISLLDIPEMITQDSLDLLQSVGVTEYQMSLDGLPDVHDEVRGKGSFEKTINAVNLLKEAGISPLIMFTLGRYNIDQLLPLCEYLSSALDDFTFAYDFVVPIGNARDESICVTSREADDILEKYYLFSKKHSIGNRRFQQKPSKYRVYELLKSNKPIQTMLNYPMLSGCHIGWNSIAILQNGDVLPCRRLPIVLGNLKETSFEEIFLNSDLLRKFRRFHMFQETCGTCEYGVACRGCPAISYATSGDCFKPFTLCSHQASQKYEPKCYIPSMDCSNLEELEYIKSGLPNYFLSHPIHSSPLFPKMLTAFKAFKKVKTRNGREYDLWMEEYGNKMNIEEVQCFMSLMSSKKQE